LKSNVIIATLEYLTLAFAFAANKLVEHVPQRQLNVDRKRYIHSWST